MPQKPAVIVLDNGPVHRSKATLATLATRADLLKPEWPAKHAPELNDIEHEWKTLKAHHLAHKTFKDTDGLKTGLCPWWWCRRPLAGLT